jgi:hypothetical protein
MRPVNALVAMALAAAGCGHEVTEVAASTPKGRITGKVLDLYGQALVGVEIRASNGATTTTAEAGLFALENVTAGSTVGLAFRLSGYAPAYATAEVSSSAGNFPLGGGEVFVGPIRLEPTTGELTLNVIGYDGLAVAKLAGTLGVTPGYLDFSRTGSADPGVGSIAVQATGRNGVLKFAGIPKVEDLASLESIDLHAHYSVYVAPILNDDGTLRYGGATASFSALTLWIEPWTRTLVLPAPEAKLPVQIVAASIANLLDVPSRGRDNLAGKAGPISVVFNQRINPDDLSVEIRNDSSDPSASTRLPLTTEITPIGNQLRIALAPGSAFTDGMKYQLILQAHSADDPSAAPLAINAPLFGGSVETSSTSRGLGSVAVSYVESTSPADGKFGAGERLEITFERYLGRGESAAFKVPVYFNDDLDGNGSLGNAPGEKGSGRPLCLSSEEWAPAEVADAKLSGYARKVSASFEEIQSQVVGPHATMNAIVANKAPVLVTIAFSESSKCGGPIHTVWGDPLISDSAGRTLSAQ